MNIPLLNRRLKELIASAEMIVLHLKKTYYERKPYNQDTIDSLLESIMNKINKIKGEHNE